MTLAAGYVEFDPDGDVVLILQQASEMSDACEGAVDNEVAAEDEPGEAAIEGAEEANSVEEGSHDDEESSPDQARETDHLLPMRVCRPSPSSESAHSIASIICKDQKTPLKTNEMETCSDAEQKLAKSLLKGYFSERSHTFRELSDLRARVSRKGLWLVATHSMCFWNQE